MNTQRAVVLDKPQFTEAIHEEANPRAGCAHHLGKHFLAYFGNHRLWCPILAKLGKQQQGPRQALFTRIEELVDQVLLDANVAGKHVGNEDIGESVVLVECPYHFFSVDLEYR